MNINAGNHWYFLYIVIFVGLFVGLHFLLRRRSSRTKWIVLYSILILNFAIHFAAPFLLHMDASTQYSIRRITLQNICAVSAVTFPFIILMPSRFLRTGMITLGILSGFASLVYPDEVLGRGAFDTNVIRFYVQHIIIVLVPLLILSLGLYKLRFRDIWMLPVYFIIVLFIVTLNSVMLSYTGLISGAPHTNNQSFQWGTNNQMAILFDWITPNFLQTVPFGPNAGAAQPIPVLHLVPALAVYTIFLQLVAWGFYFLYLVVSREISDKQLKKRISDWNSDAPAAPQVEQSTN